MIHSLVTSSFALLDSAHSAPSLLPAQSNDYRAQARARVFTELTHSPHFFNGDPEEVRRLAIKRAEKRRADRAKYQKVRAKRKTHFPPSPKPSDHVRFLHADSPRDGSSHRYAGLRRLSPDAPLHKGQPNDLPPYMGAKVSVDRLLEHANSLVGEKQVYLTQADFAWGKGGDPNKHRCSRPYIVSIGTLFVDIDCYSVQSQYRDRSLDDIVRLIFERLDCAGIPRPVVIHSGRGLYLDWALKKRLSLKSENNVKKWQDLQSRLIHLLHDFGADPKVKDLTRILRLVGTVNEKSNATVSVLHDDGQFHCIERLKTLTQHLPLSPYYDRPPQADPHTLREAALPTSGYEQALPQLGQAIASAYAYSRSTSRWVIPDTQLALFQSGMHIFQARFEEKKISPRSLAHRYYRFFLDLCDLAAVRQGVASGWRNEFVFWGVTFLSLSRCIRSDEVEWAATLLSHACEGHFNTFERGCLISLIERIQGDEAYRYNMKERNALFKRVMRENKKKQAQIQADRYGSFPLKLPNGKPNPRAGIRVNVQFTELPSYFKTRTQGMKAIPVPMRFQGWGLRTYTPSVATLIMRMGIALDEQRHLRSLVGVQERKRRRSATPERYALQCRNYALIAQHDQGYSARTLAKQFDVSLATVYRVISTREKWQSKPEPNGHLPAPVRPLFDVQGFDSKAKEDASDTKSTHLNYYAQSTRFTFYSHNSLVSIGGIGIQGSMVRLSLLLQHLLLKRYAHAMCHAFDTSLTPLHPPCFPEFLLSPSVFPSLRTPTELNDVVSALAPSSKPLTAFDDYTPRTHL